MKDFVRTVEASILRQRLMRRGQSLIVAVSGGVDSMVLLHVLQRLAQAHSWKLVVAHFNHRLRGRSSDADEGLVRSSAKRLKLACVVEGADVRAFAREERLSVEMAARQLRHDFLARTARARGLCTIALAHHADDQVELFFLRLLRGAGAEGLAGMKWISPSPGDARIALVRPLLDEPKAALLEFACRERIPFREDASNESFDLPRNRIRHELLPLLTRSYQPALARVILRQMEVLGAEADYVKQVARAWLDHERQPGFDELPIAVQRRCVQLQLFTLGASADFDRIERLRAAAGQAIQISPGLMVSRDARGDLSSRTAAPVHFEPGSRVLDLNIPSGTAGFAHLTVRWRIAKQTSARRPGRSAGCEWFDADKIGHRIVLRHWCRGDRFQPIGMGEAVKLQDLFINAKISRARRHQLVVAATGVGEVFWVEGLRISERFKLDKDTVRRLKWQWQGGKEPPVATGCGP